jgi:hypothetical protein
MPIFSKCVDPSEVWNVVGPEGGHAVAEHLEHRMQSKRNQMCSWSLIQGLQVVCCTFPLCSAGWHQVRPKEPLEQLVDRSWGLQVGMNYPLRDARMQCIADTTKCDPKENDVWSSPWQGLWEVCWPHTAWMTRGAKRTNPDCAQYDLRGT